MDSISPGFHFTHATRRLCSDLCARLPELSHIDMSRVAVGFCQARKNVPHGYQATLTPLRFENGARTTTIRGREYSCPAAVAADGHEYLYLLNFYLPRFLNHHLGEKLTTVIHELWHISPEFDGDLRRHPGRCYIHGPSQKDYDRTAARLAGAYLATQPSESTYGFLRHSFAQLVAKHGKVVGERFAAPRLVPLQNG